MLAASNSFFLRILDNEKAEIFGSLLVSGFGATGVSSFEVLAVSVSVGLTAFSTFEVGFTVSALSTLDFELWTSTIE